jgi:hypothetical protein
MDFLRSHHLTPSAAGIVRKRNAVIRWYPALPTALAFPDFHAFISPVWEDTPDRWTIGPGCYHYTHWRRTTYPSYPGLHYHGDLEWYKTGIPDDIRGPVSLFGILCGGFISTGDGGGGGSSDGDIVPEFVQAGRGGEAEGGSWPQGVNNELTAVGGEAEGGTSVQLVGPAQVGRGGEAEGGSSPQGVNNELTAVGGEAEGGTSVQLVGPAQVGRGGEAEGGTSVQLVGPAQVGRGGEAEGGTSVQLVGPAQVGRGGEAEGGSSPQGVNNELTAVGGEAEGGTSVQLVGPAQVGRGGEAEGGSSPQSEGAIQHASGGEAEGGTAGQSTSGGGPPFGDCPSCAPGQTPVSVTLRFSGFSGVYSIYNGDFTAEQIEACYWKTVPDEHNVYFALYKPASPPFNWVVDMFQDPTFVQRWDDPGTYDCSVDTAFPWGMGAFTAGPEVFCTVIPNH